LGGFGLYSLITAYGGGVDLEDLVTFDLGGELDFGGILVFWGIVAGVLIGVPLGCYLALRLLHAPRAGKTALVSALSAAAMTAAALIFRVFAVERDRPRRLSPCRRLRHA
jgi:ABC-type dipeptide/oligopeptide/nickel transport system permease component